MPCKDEKLNLLESLHQRRLEKLVRDEIESDIKECNGEGQAEADENNNSEEFSVLNPEILRRPGVRLTEDGRCLAELSRLVQNEYPMTIRMDFDPWSCNMKFQMRDTLMSFLRKVELLVLKPKPNQEENKHMSENSETLNKFKKLIKDPEAEKDEAEELKKYVIDAFPKGDADFDYLELDDSAESDAILYRLRNFGVIENLEFSIESKNKKISAMIQTDEDFNEYKEVLDSMFIKGKGNISWTIENLGNITEDFQNGDDAEDIDLESEYILVYSHKLNKFRLYNPKEFEFAWGTTYDKLYENDDEGNEPEVQSEAVVETPKKTSNSNCISWT